MRIFVVEYITGGGQHGSALNAGLLPEAELMLEALLGDLLEIEDVELLVSRDARLPPLQADCGVFVPRGDADIWAQWRACIDSCDAVWPVMPESGGLLQRISELTLARGRHLIGSRPAAVAVAASKYRTAERLRQAGIAALPAFRVDATIPRLPGPWVVKPDDGVGCEGIEVFPDHAGLCLALRDRERYRDCIAQPFLDGEAASLSLLCDRGAARLLTVNLQQIVRAGNALALTGLQVNGRVPVDDGYRDLGAAVAAALPGLWGYAGVDLVITPDGPVIVEVNPRLTTSYAGIYSALGVNPAALILQMLCGVAPPARAWGGSNCVNLDLEALHVA